METNDKAFPPPPSLLTLSVFSLLSQSLFLSSPILLHQVKGLEARIVMNNLSNAALKGSHFCSFKPIPPLALYILMPLFLLGFAVSIFILIVVHNAAFFVSFILLSALVIAFLCWNTRHWRNKGAIFLYLRSFPDSDLRKAKEGQLVKITGVPTLSLSLYIYIYIYIYTYIYIISNYLFVVDCSI